MPGEPYLEYPKTEILRFLGAKKTSILFIPYAAVSFSFDLYESKVKERFAEIGHDLISIHHFSNPAKAIQEADAIVVGGGNTWQLVRLLNEHNLMGVIRERVISGMPYLGWSAGANIACPTVRTTNDMPIVDPKGFNCLNLVSFQINPHYLDSHPQGHGGETREQRIEEFIELNEGINVIGLREGTMLKLEEEKLELIGKFSARLFRKGCEPKELKNTDDLNFLLK